MMGSKDGRLDSIESAYIEDLEMEAVVAATKQKVHAKEETKLRTEYLKRKMEAKF